MDASLSFTSRPAPAAEWDPGVFATGLSANIAGARREDQAPVSPAGRLRVAPVPGKDRGVLAAAPIAAGEVIELAPVLVCPAGEEAHFEKTALYAYCYAWGPRLEHTAIGLGFASLYNHSYTPNAIYHRQLNHRLIVFVARRDIAVGEEITINYNHDPMNRDPVWFEVKET